jgi:WXG100 family type VII secretion target
MSIIQYNYPRMEELASQLNSNFNQLEHLATTLKSEVARLHENWQSQQASQAYGSAQQSWDTSFTDSRALLTALSSRVTEASNNMQAADHRTAGYFS